MKTIEDRSKHVVCYDGNGNITGIITPDGKFHDKHKKNNEMKTIREADLLRLKFERVDVLEEESGDADYFYFIFDPDGNKSNHPILITVDEDNKEDSYTVEINELYDAVVIRDLDDLESLVDIIKRNLNNE